MHAAHWITVSVWPILMASGSCCVCGLVSKAINNNHPSCSSDLYDDSVQNHTSIVTEEAREGAFGPAVVCETESERGEYRVRVSE